MAKLQVASNIEVLCNQYKALRRVAVLVEAVTVVVGLKLWESLVVVVEVVVAAAVGVLAT